jgi:hypothetical protein
MAFSESSLPLSLRLFINSFIMICDSMLSVSHDGLLREMLLLKYRLQIYLINYYIHDFQNLILVSNSIVLFGWGDQKLFWPPYKALGWGPAAPPPQGPKWLSGEATMGAGVASSPFI